MAVVLITGCRSGIGLQTALAFARRGDRVYATSRDVVRAEQLRQSVDRESLPVEIQTLDVTDGDAARRMIGNVVAREGRIDVLVNNAGIGVVSAIEEIDEDVARAVWETNFWAPFRLIRAVLPHMRGQGSGVICEPLVDRCPVARRPGHGDVRREQAGDQPLVGVAAGGIARHRSADRSR